MFSLDLFKYLSLFLVATLIAVGGICKLKVDLLEENLQESIKANVAYESSILFQNSEIESERVDKEKVLKELDKWKSLPPKVKWKTITKTIYRDVNISNREATCEELKLIEANAYNLDWNNL